MKQVTLNDNYKGIPICLIELCEQDVHDLHTYFKQKRLSPTELHKKLLKSFMEEHNGFDPETVVAFGSSDVTPQFAAKYVEKVQYLSRDTYTKRTEIRDCYRCNSSMYLIDKGDGTLIERWKAHWINGTIIHEDALSAWNCALQIIGKPSFSAIIHLQG